MLYYCNETIDDFLFCFDIFKVPVNNFGHLMMTSKSNYTFTGQTIMSVTDNCPTLSLQTMNPINECYMY